MAIEIPVLNTCRNPATQVLLRFANRTPPLQEQTIWPWSG